MTGEKKRHQVGMKTMEGSRQRKQELVSKLIDARKDPFSAQVSFQLAIHLT